MSELAKCPNCGQSPSIAVRTRAVNWGAAEMRCCTGVPVCGLVFLSPLAVKLNLELNLKNSG